MNNHHRNWGRGAWVLAMVALAVHLTATWPQLPERMATHFDASGVPNGWMNRSSHVAWVAVIGFLVSSGVVVFLHALRFLPASMLNIPNREHWLAPAQRDEAYRYLGRHSYWFGFLMTCLAIGIHWLVMRTNVQTGQRLPALALWAFMGIFLMGILLWTFAMMRHFSRPR